MCACRDRKPAQSAGLCAPTGIAIPIAPLHPTAIPIATLQTAASRAHVVRYAGTRREGPTPENDGVELHDHRRKCFSRFEIAVRRARPRGENGKVVERPARLSNCRSRDSRPRAGPDDCRAVTWVGWYQGARSVRDLLALLGGRLEG